ncbi:MAG: thioredoxin family protein, partial [Rhodospirillales bacterium]|nr:thioredoxin family protein [Rhodospirillales bacterium]
YLICDEICIPMQTPLALDLPAGDGGVSAEAHLINRFAARVPPLQSETMPSGPGGLAIERAGIAKGGDGAEVLRVSVVSAEPFVAPDLFVDGPAGSVFGAPKVAISANGRGAVLDIPADTSGVEGGIDGKTLSLTLVDGERGIERRLPPESTLPPMAESGASQATPIGLLAILGLALIGGLILNLMPCVLPVLSIKLLGVISHGGGERRMVRIGFLASAAGIVSAFLVLAGALVALKYSGAAVGWGIQFQQPWFLVLMVLIVTLFACNLWGFFEVRLPRWIADAGEQAGHVHGLGGHFVSGVFATLLATPCSAPFLGTAVGFALSRGAVEILAVFAALGVGLALPYLVVAAFPGMATRLPRPGPWMVTLRKVMGFALAATGVWLVTVLAAQVGMIAATAIAILSALAIAVLFLRARLPQGVARFTAAILGVLAFLAFLSPTLLDTQGTKTSAVEDGLWTTFDESAIPGLLAEGKVVFVDVTADWCITCQVNKQLVIYNDAVRARVFGPDVVAMKADWTKPDDRIADYLSRFGRYGIPFNAVYGPAAPQGIALPELLTTDAVMAAMDKAAGKIP